MTLKEAKKLPPVGDEQRIVKAEVILHSCNECYHQDHSGQFTLGGAQPICKHPDAISIRGKGHKDKHYWKHRVLPFTTDDHGRVKDWTGEIPDWCPLLHGSKY